MSGKVTKDFRLYNAEQLYESISETNKDNLYLFIAKSSAWVNDTQPPSPVDSVGETTYSVWDNMLSFKRITEADVSYCIPRVGWTSGSVYTQYSYDTEYYTTNNFYVVTEDYNVYLCLSNNNGGASTVKPTGMIVQPFNTSDGYRWKYIYTVSAGDALKFLTVNYLPVKKLTSDDGTAQWDVQTSAKQGVLDQVNVTSGGAGYLYTTGAAITANTSTITLAGTADATADIYNNSALYINSGTGQGQFKKIVNYSGAGRVATVNSAFSPVPDTSSTYIIAPEVVVAGNGTGFKGYANVSTGVVNRVEIIAGGNSYITATATLSANTSHGSGCVLKPQISPYNGHGADAVHDLYAHNVMFNVKLTGNEANTFFVANDYRVLGLIKNPVLANNSLAVSTVYDQTTVLTFTSTTGTFSTDETIVGSTTGASSQMVAYRANNSISVTGNSTGYQVGETITGGSSSKVAVITGIKAPSLKKYSGRVMYIENRLPIIRSADQQEDIKIITRF